MLCVKIGRCLPADFIKLWSRAPHFSKSCGQMFPVESSKAMELGAISKIVISAKSAPISAQRGSLWDATLGFAAGALCWCCSSVGTGDECPALGLWPHQREGDHAHTCTVLWPVLCKMQHSEKPHCCKCTARLMAGKKDSSDSCSQRVNLLLYYTILY